MEFSIDQKLNPQLVKLSKFSELKLMTSAMLICIAIMLPFSYLADFKDVFTLKFDSLLSKFVSTVITGPLVETFLMQYLVIELAKKYVNSYFAGLLISATLFGISHNYSIAYIFATFVAGLILAMLYIVLKIKYSHPFLLVFVFHGAYNSIGFIYDLIAGETL